MSNINPNLKDTRTLDTLHEDPKNARRHPTRNLDAIKASLAQLGQQKPIVVDAKGKIIAGNGTYRAAQALGWDRIAVVEFQGTAKQARQFALADNRTAELAEWDVSVLQSEMRDLGAGSWEPVGFTEDELRDMTGQLPSASAPTADGGEQDTAGADLRHDNDDIGKTPDDKLDTFMNNALRQIVLIYPAADHARVVAALERIMADKGLPDNTSVVDYLLRAYATGSFDA
jgi:hypothetical protein